MDGPSTSDASVYRRFSVALTGETEGHLVRYLIRPDGQEDLCMAVYQPSRGAERFSALLSEVILPEEGETEVHGNVTFTGDYVLRAASIAAKAGGGVAILHSHPGGGGWQGMSKPDADAEASYANLVREITGLPLVGMTLAGSDRTWSARVWARGSGSNVAATWCDNVRVIADRFRISWNPRIPAPSIANEQLIRTVSCWGEKIQQDISRLRVLVVGVGTSGLDVAVRLAMTGLQRVAFMDYDSLELHNLDRLSGATLLDVWLGRSKIEVASRMTRQNATAENFEAVPIEGSICQLEAFNQALDYDLIFCCIDDHPWPRSVLNVIAYSDLIPVIDGGIHIDAFPDGSGMRNAVWRSHVLRPGRPCMACNGQLDLGKIHVDKDRLMDDPEYIAGLPPSERPRSQNVAILSGGVSASLLAQFVSYVVTPAGIGDPGPLRYNLSTHWLEHQDVETRAHCPVEQNIVAGDRRQVLLDVDNVAGEKISARDDYQSHLFVRVWRRIDDAVTNLRLRSDRWARSATSTSGANVCLGKEA